MAPFDGRRRLDAVDERTGGVVVERVRIRSA
jgi:hypothetical protein